jgi:hypothetical protein
MGKPLAEPCKYILKDAERETNVDRKRKKDCEGTKEVGCRWKKRKKKAEGLYP